MCRLLLHDCSKPGRKCLDHFLSFSTRKENSLGKTKIFVLIYKILTVKRLQLWHCWCWWNCFLTCFVYLQENCGWRQTSARSRLSDGVVSVTTRPHVGLSIIWVSNTGAKSILLKWYQCWNGAWTDTFKRKGLRLFTLIKVFALKWHGKPTPEGSASLARTC